MADRARQFVAAVPGGGVPAIGRVPAQRLARAELSRAIYHPHPSLLARIGRTAATWVRSVLGAAQALPGGWVAVAVLLGLAVVVVVALLSWAGPLARSHRRPTPSAALGQTRTAQGHRDEAQRLAQDGDYSAAICEAVRAVAAELGERGVLPPRAGRTADELAREAGDALPACAGPLHHAALLFDEVFYGARDGTAAGYALVRDVDLAVVAAARRPGRSGTEPRPSAAGHTPIRAGRR